MKNPFTILATVLGLFTVLVLGIVILAVSGDSLSANAKQTIITVLVANVFTVIPALLSLQRTESVQYDLRNGLIPEKVKEALDDHKVATTDDVVAIIHNNNSNSNTTVREEKDDG